MREQILVSRPPPAKVYDLDTGGVNGKIASSILRYRYDVIAVENHLVKQILGEFNTALKELDLLFDPQNPMLLSALSRARTLPALTKLKHADELDQPITLQNANEFAETMLPYVQHVLDGLLSMIDLMVYQVEVDLADTEPRAIAAIINRHLTPLVPVIVDVTGVPEKVLVKHVLQNQRVLEATRRRNRAALARQHNRALAKVKKRLIAGLVAGHKVKRIAADVRGIVRKEFGYGAALLGRTRVQQVVTQAANELYQENIDVVGSEIWLITFDLKICLICANLDGNEYPVGQGPQPIEDTHPNCRCLRVPRVKSWEELGVDPSVLPPAARRQMDGAAPERVSFADWFHDLDEKDQREILGAQRFELFQGGDLDITDFVRNNRLLNIRQLRRRHGL